MDIKKMINSCFIEVENEYAVDLINLAKKTYKEENIICIFFHYNNSNTINDLNIVKSVESKTKIHIEYIDISKIYSEFISINKQLNCFNEEFKEHKKEIRYQNILLDIKDNIKEMLFKIKRIPEFKGV